MKRSLLDGPAGSLSCLRGRYLADLVESFDTTRRSWPHLDTFRERLQNDLIERSRQQQWVVSASLAGSAEMRLAWLEQLIHAWAPGHLALTRLCERLDNLKINHSGNLREALGHVAANCRERLAQCEQQLLARDLEHEAQQQARLILARWASGDFATFSPAGSCYVALEELRWGIFGDAVRLGGESCSVRLLQTLREHAARQLAAVVNAAPRTRHFYSQWLTAPSSVGLMDSKDTLSWLGSWSDDDKHPVSWSVTQTWQSVALGMPRLCSAVRLVDAMQEELFDKQ